MHAEDAKQIADAAIEQLAQALERGDSATLETYLAAAARFHAYSFGNIMLIAAQRPDATRVAGFNAWRKLGRFVKKGEKGIVIIAPVVYRKNERRDASRPMGEPDNDIQACLVGFRAAHVFDVAQTDGEPLPDFAEVTGDPGPYTERLRAFVRRLGIVFKYSFNLDGAYGVSKGGVILLQGGLPPSVEFSVLVHELAHELLHTPERRRETTKTVRETEAEAVAFIVTTAIGLETNTASADYIRLYQGTKETLMESLDAIQRAATQILAAIKPDQA